jgi:hypothetical protein
MVVGIWRSGRAANAIRIAAWNWNADLSGLACARHRQQPFDRVQAVFRKVRPN